MAHPILVRKHARQEGGYDRVKVGCRHAEADQRPHVGAAVHNRVPAAPEEWQRRPEDDRRGQHELQIACDLMPYPVAHRRATNSPIVRMMSGTAAAAEIHIRRVKSASSALGASEGTIGSRAMPQIGQDPGASRTISGASGRCTGHFAERSSSARRPAPRRRTTDPP